MKGMRIPSLGKLVTGCWATAERELRKSVERKFIDRDEEFITSLFHGELQSEFDRVSAKGAVAKAFLSDLKQAFPTFTEGSLFEIACGLIVSVNFHPNQVESETGGDLGVVLVRPDVRRARYQTTDLTVEHDYRRGLLCQAKMFRRDSRWGGLTSTQQQVLRERLSYCALLLYQYSDQRGRRSELAPFAWQLTRDATVEQVAAWLGSGQFPGLQDSLQILGALLADRIGTDDSTLIASNIAPPLRPSLVVTIRWKDGDDPGDTVRVKQRFVVQGKQQVAVGIA